MLSESDKTWIIRTFGQMLAGYRIPLEADRHKALTEFAGELEGLLRPLVDEVVALRGEIESLKAGLVDAASQITESDSRQDPDDWWMRGETSDE